MTKFKKLLALTLSMLLILSALPMTSWAAEEVIKWRAGYRKGKADDTQPLYDGYPDIPYSITLAGYEGDPGTWANIGNDEGATMVLANNNHYLHYDITTQYTGKYKLEAEVSTNNAAAEVLHAYANGEEIGTLNVADGGYCSFTEGFRELGTVNVVAGTPVRISFSNQTSDNSVGSAMICIRDITLTLVEETQGGETEPEIPEDTTKEETIRWKGGYDTGSQGNSSGTLYEGFEDIPWYITLTLGGESEAVGNIGQDWGDKLQISQNGAYANYDVTPSYTGEYSFSIKTASAGGGTMDVYVDGEKKFSYTADDTGAWNTVGELKAVGNLVLEGEKEITISFKKTSGAVTLCECELTYVGEAELPDDTDPDVPPVNPEDPDVPPVEPEEPEEYQIKWMAGYDSGSRGESSGTLYEGYEDIPWYITQIANGEPIVIGGIGQDWGWYVQISNNTCYINYDITPGRSGIYCLELATASAGGGTLDIFVDGVRKATYTAAVTGGWNTFGSLTKAAYLELEADETVTLSFAKTAGSLTIRDCILTHMLPPTLDEVTLENDDIADASTDVISFDYSRELDEDKLSEAVVTLKDSSDNELDITLTLDESDASGLNVILNESLKYDESYTLSYSGITDIAGFVTEEGTLSFSVADEVSDNSADNASVTVDSVVLAGKTFTVTGAVYGSMEQPMSGREVCVTVSADNGIEPIMLESVVSGDDGIWTAVYNLPQAEDDNTLNGLYTFTAEAQFAAETAADSERFISEGEKQRVLGALEGALTAADVEEFLSSTANTDALGIDLAELDVFGENKSLFYERLAQETYTNESGEYDMKEFEKAWEISFALESINLSDDDEITKSYLEDESFIEEIELDTVKYEMLSENKDAFIADVTDLERQATPEDFGKKCEELLNKHLLLENDKTAPDLTLTNADVYVGQAAKIDLKLTAEVTGISGYTVTVTCPGEEAAASVALNTANSSKTSSKKSGNVITFTVSEVNPASSITKLGTLEFTSSSVASVTLNIAGSVTYDIDGVGVKADITSASTSITVKANNNKGTTGTSSSYVSGGGGGSFSPVVTPDDKTEEAKPLGEGFTDIADVTWAEESIMNLYKKGIISEAADGRFRPNDSVTRAEFVKMLVTALRITDKSAPVDLNDVSESDWYYTYVSAAVNYGLVLGNEHGNFCPNDKITRQDICVIISRAMDKLGYGKSEAGSALFNDDYMISDYARDAVYRMRAHEIVNGTGDGSFAPLSDATRAATAKMIEQFMKEAKI